MNWIESSIEGSKLFICSGCTCREAISDQEKEAAGRLADSFYCRRDFSGCLAKASPSVSVSVETKDSVKSNAGREGSDGSNCDRVFILFDIFHCSNCGDELQEDRIVYGQINENINQIREELNEMHQRLKKLLLRNCSTEFPPMDDIRKQKSRSEDKAKDTNDHKKDDIRKQRSMSEDKDKETTDHKKESITPNVSYEWSGVIDNRDHSFVPKDTEIKHKEEDSRKQRSNNEDKTKEIDDHKKESITSSVSYEWSGVIDNRVHGSVNKDTKTKHKEDDIRKQRSRSEDKAKEATDHKKELMISKVSYESSPEIDKSVHGLVLKDNEIKQKEDTIASNVSYESYVEIDNGIHGSVFNVAEIKNQEDDIRKQRSMGENKEKEIVVHKKDDIRKQRSMSEDKDKEIADHKKESILTPNVSYECSGVIDNRVHSSVLKDVDFKHKEDDSRKQRSNSEDKTKERDDHKKESITSSVSYEWSGVIDNRVHGSVNKDTTTKHKEDDIRKQRSRSEDKAKEAANHKKELMTSKVSYENSREIDHKGVHGLVLKDTEIKQKEDDIRKQRSMSEDKEKGTIDCKKDTIVSNDSYESNVEIDDRVHGSVFNVTETKNQEESITSHVSYESSGEIDNRVHGLFLNDTEIKNKEDAIGKQKSRRGDKEKETAHPQKDDNRKRKSRSKDKAREINDQKKGINGIKYL